MGAWIVSAGIVAALLGQSEPDTIASKEAIAGAVASLGAPQFTARRRASQFLWEQGLAAEPALKLATESVDREVRLRAQLILSDFRYGILPGVSADIVAMIRQFRDGDSGQKSNAVLRFADRDRFDTIQRLIGLEPDAEVRRQLLVVLLQNTRAVERFSEPERLELFIASIGADCDEAWRRTVLAHFVFSQPMIEQLAGDGRLEVLAEIVDREESDDIRRKMLGMLFQNAPAVTSLVENGRMEFVLNEIVKEQDEKTRGTWIKQVLAMSSVIQHLSEDDRLEELLEFAQKHVGAEQQGEIIKQVFLSSSVVKAILEKRGMDRLIALVDVEKDPGARGRLLAVLIATSAVREHLTQSGQYKLALELANKEKNPTTRNEYLTALLSSGIGYTLLRDQDARNALWELIKSDKSGKKAQLADWRGEAIYRMLTTSSTYRNDLLKDEALLDWLLSFLRDEFAPEGRTKILDRLVVDYRLKEILLNGKRFDTILAMVKEMPASHRGRLMGQLFASSDPFKGADKDQRAKLMVALAKDESDADSRRQYLLGLFKNSTAMSALVAGGYFDELWKLVCDEKDTDEYAMLRGAFLRSPDVVKVFVDRKQLDSLVQFARDCEDAETREEYLKELFASAQAMTSLIEAGHYEALFTLAKAEDDEDSRVYLLSQFYGNSQVIDQLIKEKQTGTLLKFAERYADDRRMLTFLQRVFFNQQAVGALVEEGHADTMLEIVSQRKDQYLRDSLMRTLFGSAQVVKHFAENERLEEMFEMIGGEKADSRYQIYYNMIMRSDTIAVLVEHEWIESFLDLVKTEEKPDRLGQLLGRLVVHSKVLDYLVKQEQLDLIFQLAREQKDERARRPYLEAVFSSTATISVLLDKGHFDELYRLASSNSDPGQRIQHRARLLTSSKGVEHLVAEGRIELLLQMVSEQTDQPSRRLIVARIITSPAAIAALVEHGKFAQLVTLCRSATDPASRRRILGEFLMSAEVIRQLATAGTLGETLGETLQEEDDNLRKQYLTRLLSQSDAVDALVEHGQFEVLYKAVASETDDKLRGQLLGQFFTGQNTIQHLAASGKVDLVLKLVSDEADRSLQTQLLTNILGNADAVKAILDSGHFDQFVELISAQPDDTQRRSLMARLLYSAATLEYLAENGQMDRLREELAKLDDPSTSRQIVQHLLYQEAGRRLLGSARLGTELVALLESDPEDRYRQSFASYVLSNQQVWQALIGSGQVQVIYKVAEMVPDAEQRRTGLQRVLYAPSGLVPYHMRRGEVQEVTRLLEENADDDLGRLRLATYLLATGKIDERIAKLRAALQATGPAALSEGPADADPQSVRPGARLLAHLLRAKGDLSGAIQAAELTEDPGLLRGLLVEGRRWSEAAELQAAGPCPLPVPTGYQPADKETHRQAEQLGLVAAYQRLAGRTDDLAQTTAQIRELGAYGRVADRTDDGNPIDSEVLIPPGPADLDLVWLCIEALLLNDRVEEGIQLAAGYWRLRAFDLYVYRHQYEEALALANWTAETMPDDQWLQALPVEVGNKGATPEDRLELPLKVARTLHSLGRLDELERLLKFVDAYSGRQGDNGSSSSSSRRVCWELLSKTLLDMAYLERAWEVAARTVVSPSSTPHVLSLLYVSRYDESRGWWQFFRSRHSEESPAATFSRVHAALNPSPDEEDGQFVALATEAMEWAESRTDSYRKSVLVAACRTCLHRGEIELALRCLEPVADDLQPQERVLQAGALRQSGQWSEAAQAYHAAWEADRSQLSALYLAGDALERVGRGDEGRTQKELALLMALESRARLNLGLDMIRAGLRDDGIAQLRLVLRTAPIEHPEWNEAARQLGSILQQDNRAEAIQMLEFSLLDDLRTWFSLLNKTDYLRTPATIHRLRAMTAIDEGRLEQAENYIQRALTAAPADTNLAEELVPQLESAGKNDMADDLFRQMDEAFARWSLAYPESGLLNNDYAWLMARCGRELQRAMVHAKKAVEIAPANASYLDTLAEVHFQQGDRESAVELSRRAAHLSPDSETLHEQLERFQNDKLPSS